MISWASRILTSVLLALSWFRPDLDYLHLSYVSPSPRTRAYFSVSLALEIYVRAPCALLYHVSNTKHFFYSDHCQLFFCPSAPKSAYCTANRHFWPSSHANTSYADIYNPGRPNTCLSPREPDLLASLSLSSKPIIATPSNPIFGLPSLVPPTSSVSSTFPDEDAMDWTPTDPSSSNWKSNNSPHKHKDDGEDDGSLLRPQRFFPPEYPTGLEGLFAKTSFFSEESASNPRRRNGGKGSSWMWVCGLSLILLVGVTFKAWQRWSTVPIAWSDEDPSDL
jgi:hypothetical protein